MKKINEAYDQIQKERQATGGSSSYGYGGSYHSSYSSASSSPEYYEVRTRINNRDYIGAETILNGISADRRGAEWNFLMGCVCYGKNNVFDAQKYIDQACYMDPNNVEYRTMQSRLRNSGAYRTDYGQNPYGTSTFGIDDSTCDLCGTLCGTLICLNCLCRR